MTQDTNGENVKQIVRTQGRLQASQVLCSLGQYVVLYVDGTVFQLGFRYCYQNNWLIASLKVCL